MSTSETAPDPLAARLTAYAAALRATGAIRTDRVQEAFAAVRRDRCLTHFRLGDQHISVPQDTIPTADVLDIVYSGQPLLTRTGAVPSSSSAPTIMARMLEALDPHLGHRVLEIGAGTGYNAALIAHLTRAPVVTVEAHPPTAAEATASIRRLALDDQITVLTHDGYHGAAGHAPYDRIIVTCGIAGIPPRWLDQLTGTGLILAPVAHGGLHPILAVSPDGTAAARIGGDFMPAAGPLRHPALVGRNPAQPVPTKPTVWSTDLTGALDQTAYHDLWFHLATRDTRITRAWMDDDDFDFTAGQLALHDPDHGTAWAQNTGRIIATHPDPGKHLTTLVSAWLDTGQPAL
ncbi:protein-L-isoaspartate O-methyltransferase family protein, partial [Candidatus Protofrankia californiensis]|uniref:protein-L-isoaspartate O-methyltransferase family protein n=1 Tax=Candidatus Protofrankia californiensis TaxID=1839754 RepID=UPI001041471B